MAIGKTDRPASRSGGNITPTPGFVAPVDWESELDKMFAYVDQIVGADNVLMPYGGVTNGDDVLESVVDEDFFELFPDSGEQVYGAANKVRIPYYKDVGRLDEAYQLVIEMLSEHSPTYHQLLMRFQGQGPYARLNVQYSYDPIEDPDPNYFTAGKVEPRVKLPDNTTRKISESFNLADVKDIILLVRINPAIQYQVPVGSGTNTRNDFKYEFEKIMITFIHELAVHLVRFAEIMVANPNTRARIDALRRENQDIHHADLTNPDSYYRKIVDEMLAYYHNATVTQKIPFNLAAKREINQAFTDNPSLDHVDAMHRSTYNKLLWWAIAFTNDQQSTNNRAGTANVNPQSGLGGRQYEKIAFTEKYTDCVEGEPVPCQ